MTEYVIQIVSGLRVTSASTKSYGHMVTPMAPFLFIAGDLGDPFHVSYMHFLSWSSCNWERIVFVAGAEEYASGPPDAPGDVDIQCRLLASRFHNVRFLQGQVDGSIPGLQLVGASLTGSPDQTRFLERHMHDDCVLLTYGCACDAAWPLDHTGCLRWVCGSPCTVCAAAGLVHNVYGPPTRPYDSSFYITLTIKSSTFYFVSGCDDFPPVTKAVVAPVDARAPRRRFVEGDNVCYYCGHAGHAKNHCPLIQCALCGAFGHSDRSCPCLHSNKGCDN